jgi:phage minor structural protein
MIPKLYESTEMDFKSNGLGSLHDAISCKVTEERNGCYELELEYPVGGLHYDLIENNRIIYAKPNETSDPQPFDIKEITPSMDKMTAKVYAQHVRYRMNGIPVSPFNAQGINDALSGLKQYSLIKHPFTFYTDIINTSSKFNVELPGILGSLLGGKKGSILDTFSGSAGCEYEFDRFNVKLHAHRGTDSGVSIRYAKNLTGCKMESSIETVYTGVLAFWQKEEDGKEQLLSGDIQYIANHDSYPREYIYMLDCSSDFEEAPTVEQLNAKASNYATNNHIGEPSVSIDVSFIPLWGTEEYKAVAPLERVCLCDPVTVRFDLLGVNVKAIVNKTVYDVLTERYDSISIGSAKSKLGETIKQEVHDQAEAVKKDTISAVQGSIDKAVDKIRGGTNGHVILSVNSNGETNELYAYDGNSLETASKVLRLNYEGIAGTDKGVNGKYNVAITTDGQINASSVKFGKLDGNLIKAKSLQIGSFDEETENTITSSLSEAVTEWYVSTSPTEPIGGEWSETSPQWAENNYIWQRLKTINKKGEISYSEPSCVQGDKGSTGIRNLRRNSKTMIFESYSLVSSSISSFLTDENGNILTDESMNRFIA